VKKVAFGPKPPNGSKSGSPDDWVNAREGVTEPTKRLTIDIPKSLHKRVKIGCAVAGKDMVDVVREFLEQRFPPTEKEPIPVLVNTETQKHDES
jgi:plasmid stability protein